MIRGRRFFVELSLCVVVSHSAVADMVSGSTGDNALSNLPNYDSIASQATASLLNRLNQSLDMIVGQVAASNPGGGNSNANDLNSTRSTSTYHRHLYDYCLKFAGRVCGEWFPAELSEHAFNADRSPLEGIMGQFWQKLKNIGTASNPSNSEYQLWDVQSRGASILDKDGKLNRESYDKRSLKAPVAEGAANVGFETARRTMITMDEDAKRGGKTPVVKDPDRTLPPMEALRMAAGRWTLMMRNNLVSMMGEMRANMPGIEVAQDEDISQCKDYFKLLQTQQEYTKQERRLQPQALLDPQTRGQSDQQRMNLCMQAKSMSAYAVNARVQGGQLKAGSVEGEQADIRDVRVNLAMIDAGGIDANDVPSNRNYTRAEQSNDLGNYEDGGLALNKVNATNSEQITSFNKNVKQAAEDYAEVAKRIPNLKDKSQMIANQQIALGSRNLVDLNDMTPEMRQYLNGTTYRENQQNLENGTAEAPQYHLAQSSGELMMQKAGSPTATATAH